MDRSAILCDFECTLFQDVAGKQLCEKQENYIIQDAMKKTFKIMISLSIKPNLYSNDYRRIIAEYTFLHLKEQNWNLRKK